MQGRPGRPHETRTTVPVARPFRNPPRKHKISHYEYYRKHRHQWQGQSVFSITKTRFGKKKFAQLQSRMHIGKYFY
jgi:hypothetical protein